MADRPRILVTGAGGFIGRHLIPQLAALLPEAVILQASREDTGEPEAIRVDLADELQCRSAIADTRPDLVIHLAGAASVASSATDTIETWRTNFGAAFNVACALAKEGSDAAFILASSAEVYGAAFNDVATVDESVSPKPLNAYGRTKLAAEMAIGDVLRDRGKAVVLRLFNSIGPGQDERFVTSAFAAQIARIEQGLTPPTVRVGNLSSQRDFVDVRDTVRAIALTAAGVDRLPPGASFFNICSGQTRAVSEVLDELRIAARVQFEVREDPSRLRASEVPRAAGTPQAMHRFAGWRAEIPWRQTITDILAGWRETLRRSATDVSR